MNCALEDALLERLGELLIAGGVRVDVRSAGSGRAHPGPLANPSDSTRERVAEGEVVPRLWLRGAGLCQRRDRSKRYERAPQRHEDCLDSHYEGFLPIGYDSNA